MLSRRDDLSPDMCRALELIRRNVQVEAHLVDDLLDLTRIARGNFEIARDKVGAGRSATARRRRGASYRAAFAVASCVELHGAPRVRLKRGRPAPIMRGMPPGPPSPPPSRSPARHRGAGAAASRATPFPTASR